ncbi:metal ABC transporter ATP-binding protein [Anaerococcus degeneri]|uniref:Metal ABC transporter ATP-binding protein n=1 Tax=Anaerococcus degeneri TaxID=361500 RepID=A0ABS7YYY4_9FIRM|nr:metal ABC transporter ATP-binding protein [Anaerococcus degeneri]MBP2014721.1 zinc transport system ATP-binding protein [Anaerococcus degeneri]MCA2096932.1 metal ABC transporter ATP-binding protein [Anaerococcus degeneri]
MKQIEIKNLKFGYNENLILKGVNLDLDQGDFAVISGENGSGKSTLIKLILGELKKDHGSIILFGIDMEDFKNFDKIGYVPQVNEAIKVAFPVSAREYVGLNLYKEFSIFNTITKKSKSKIENTFSTLKIKDLIDRPVNTLSGGQAQRVMIARAMVNNPDILILDEPTVGIDQKSKEDFLDLLVHLNTHHGISILMITHEMDILGDYVDKVFKLKEGVIC